MLAKISWFFVTYLFSVALIIKALVKNRGLEGTYSVLGPDVTHAKSFIKLPLDEADEGSLKQTNEESSYSGMLIYETSVPFTMNDCTY